MTRLIGTIAAALLLCAGSLLTAQTQSQTVTSGNISVTVTNPPSIQCSDTFSSSISLTGFDVQNPGFADIFLVLDESGSINAADFARQRQFAQSVINQVMTGPGGARIGLVQFSGDARLTFDMTDNKQLALGQVGAMSQRGGSTCIGCGISTAQSRMQATARPQATRFMIVLTDGVNNVNVAQFPGIVTAAKNAGTKFLAIGVGSVDANEIEFIASDIPGVDTSFLINDFSQLPNILSALTAAISSPGATNVTVNVDVMPRFPVATATATAGTVLVTGSGVAWTLPALGASTSSLTLNHQHDGAGQGSLQIFAANYSDTQGHPVTIPVPFTMVNGCNTAPVANAGLDQLDLELSGTSTVLVTLDGSATTDDGLVQPLSYSWSNQDGSITATGVSPTVTVPFGVQTFTLIVSDGEFTDTDEVLVAVEDSTPPVVTSSATGPSHNGWFTGDVVVAFTVTDPESGIASSTGCGPSTVTADTVGQSFTCEATNGAGLAADASETVKRDATAPDLVISGPVNATATSASGAAVSYTDPSATDLTSGLNGAATCAPASGSLFPLGATVVNCLATDNAGHTANGSFTITVGDATPPVVGHTVAGTLGANGWYVSNVDVSFSTEDPETGVASSTGCAAATVSADTAGQTFTCTATNGAGASAADTIVVKRDATAPILTVSGPITTNPTSAAGAVVSYSAPVATDATSGVDTASCLPASGATFAPGVTTVNCSASDLAGNTTTRSFTVTVRDTTPPVITSVVANPSSLWPPNGKLKPVKLTVTAFDAVSSVMCSISKVTSNERHDWFADRDKRWDDDDRDHGRDNDRNNDRRDNDRDDDRRDDDRNDRDDDRRDNDRDNDRDHDRDDDRWDHDDRAKGKDIIITGRLNLWLRAENGGRQDRIYTIFVTCTDAAGNAATKSTTVKVDKPKHK